MHPSSDGLFFDRVVKSFGGTQALKGVSLTVPEGGIVAGEHVFVERVSMILRKGNPELKEQLNRGLAEIMKNGTYQALSQKYFKTDASCK